jgi:glyoxylase-like metal-dependent hydrolase (beta-lactamase superfamily II)
MQLGHLTVLPVLDGVARFAPQEAFPGTTADDWQRHATQLDADGRLVVEVGAFLVVSGEHRVLVDTGVGPYSIGGMRGGELLASLGRHGLTADDITDVIFTHLHIDHVGWATVRGDVTFRHATYRCHQADWDYWIAHDARMAKKLLPLQAQMETWAIDGALLPGVSVRHAPGHTPGSSVIVLSAGPERLILLGDVAMCPLQLTEPEWAQLYDVDPALARRTRESLAAELETTGTMASGPHFPDLRFGRLLPGRGRRQWRVSELDKIEKGRDE